MITEYELQLAVMRSWSSSNNFLVPNVYGKFGEMDVLLLSKANYATEFEIKITMADFNKDKKKVIKHQFYSNIYKTLIEKREGVPNRFCYVIPKGLNLPMSKLPEYAGLYEVENGQLFCKKTPPLLHKQKSQLYWLLKIARSLNAKYLYHYFYAIDSLNSVTPKIDLKCSARGDVTL